LTKTKANFCSFKFSKIIEIATYHRLYGYLEHIKRLYKLVFGFREQSPTSHVLISITESIRQSIDNTEFGCGTVHLLIKKKGLDTVNHAILITKFNHYGIRGNVHEWF